MESIQTSSNHFEPFYLNIFEPFRTQSCLPGGPAHPQMVARDLPPGECQSADLEEEPKVLQKVSEAVPRQPLPANHQII